MNVPEQPPEPTGIDVEGPLLAPSRSYIKQGYGASCGCLIMILLGSALVMRVAWGPAKKTVETAPVTITETIPLYPKGGGYTISRRTSANVNHVLEAFKALPVGAYDGMTAVLEAYSGGDHTVSGLKNAFVSTAKPYFLRPGGREARDQYTFTWMNVSAGISDIKAAYLKDCKLKKLVCTTVRDSQTDLQLTLSEPKNHLEADLKVENFNLTTEGVESVVLTVTMPATH